MVIFQLGAVLPLGRSPHARALPQASVMDLFWTGM